MDLDLKDKVAAVTGGSVGIGLAIARGLAAEGVHLALCARDAQRRLSTPGDHVHALSADGGLGVEGAWRVPSSRSLTPCHRRIP